MNYIDQFLYLLILNGLFNNKTSTIRPKGTNNRVIIVNKIFCLYLNTRFRENRYSSEKFFVN